MLTCSTFFAHFLSEKKIASNNFFPFLSGATTFQGDWFTENLQHVVLYTPMEAQKPKGKKRRRGESEKATKRVYLRVAVCFFPRLGSRGGILWCALFFFPRFPPFNIIIPPHEKPNASYTQQLIPNFSLIVVFCWCFFFSLSHSLSHFSPLISAVFISILLPFNQLLILFFFLPFLASFFFGAKSFTNFYSLFIRVRTTTAKSCCSLGARQCFFSPVF